MGADDFNGTRLSKMWKTQPDCCSLSTGFEDPLSVNYITPSETSVSMGNAVVAANPGPPKTLNGVTYNYASGLLNSAPGFSFNPSQLPAGGSLVLETRIKYPPVGTPLWGGWWAVSMNKWQREYDLAEVSNNKVDSAYIYDTSAPLKSWYYGRVAEPDWNTKYVTLTAQFFRDGHFKAWVNGQPTPWIGVAESGTVTTTGTTPAYSNTEWMEVLYSFDVTKAVYNGWTGNKLLIDSFAAYVPAGQSTTAGIRSDGIMPGTTVK